ncbi:MAG: RIP metalloprotease RseP [Lewinellaceae bacterium]|nr:RIP metalloprotease RseP [Saprospiraceae bacterium]MCB9339954.1 RIP metalloprotease RseP [Lewinellaceae bacterium]
MDILVKVGQLVLSLSILIILHEMGHFFPAKWFKTRVEKFYLFFDPWFSLFKTKRGETEYGIGWLPLGGYVKISGMIDESFDTEQMKEPPKPWEFRSKPAWQRLIIMVGGVTVNFILGFFIYAMIFWNYGRDFLPNDNLTYGIAPDSIGRAIGFEKGDKILSIGNKEFKEFNSGILKTEIIINEARDIVVERNGQRVNLTVSDETAKSLSKYENKGYNIVNPRYPFEVSVFSEQCSGSYFNKKCEKLPAEKAGMKIGDKIIALDGTPTPFFDDFFNAINKEEYKNKQVTVTVLRTDSTANRTDTLNLAMTTTPDARIGAGPYPISRYFEFGHQDYTLGEAIPKGIREGIDFLGNQISAFGQMFRGKIKASDSLGSFLTIGSMFPSTWDWQRFWQMTAFLSLILAFINLLPIPALDGGHVMFLLFEVLTGKKPSDKVMEYSTMAGFVILIAIMVYALGLDISRFI